MLKEKLNNKNKKITSDPIIQCAEQQPLYTRYKERCSKKKKKRKVGITKDGAGTDVVIRDIKQSFFVTNITFEKV